MELELGLKIAKTRDELTSMAEFQFAKDRTGPVFLSSEDDNMFILTVHLKGQLLLPLNSYWFLLYQILAICEMAFGWEMVQIS